MALLFAQYFGDRAMPVPRINFADQEPDPPPSSWWIPRLLVTALIAGCAAYAHVYFGFGLRFF
jgi:hypothetical protein